MYILCNNFIVVKLYLLIALSCCFMIYLLSPAILIRRRHLWAMLAASICTHSRTFSVSVGSDMVLLHFFLVLFWSCPLTLMMSPDRFWASLVVIFITDRFFYHTASLSVSLAFCVLMSCVCHTLSCWVVAIFALLLGVWPHSRWTVRLRERTFVANMTWRVSPRSRPSRMEKLHLSIRDRGTLVREGGTAAFYDYINGYITSCRTVARFPWGWGQRL